MSVITEIPRWYCIFCLILGGGYAFLLYYYKDRLFQDAPRLVKRLMAAFRFVVVSFLAFLLLSPLIEIIKRRVEKPIIVIAQDASQSIVLGRDSAYMNKEYPQQLKALEDKLAGNYEVKVLSFGDAVKDKFNGLYGDKQTNISRLFEEINTRYGDKNLGAVILATDGLYNQGSNPVYMTGSIKVPIFTVALGDTTLQKDVVLAKVEHNRTVYLGNTFPLQVKINARKCNGELLNFTVSQGNNILFSKPVEVSSGNYSISIPVLLDAKTKGIQQYHLQVSYLNGEVSKTNNSRDIFVEVIENKQKILLLANVPHPDVTAIKNIVENADGYELEVSMPGKFNGNLQAYNAVILHQLPALQNPMPQLLDKLKQANMPTWYILGTQSNIPVFNTRQSLLTITGTVNRSNEVLPAYNAGFSLFTVSDAAQHAIVKFPPLLAPFGTYKTLGSAYPLLFQQIGSVKTPQPLLLLGDVNGARTAVLCGEGIWKWSLMENMTGGANPVMHELVTKTLQYLCVREEKKKFKVTAKNNYLENEPVNMDATLYNDSYELVNTPDVALTITNGDKKQYPYNFSHTDKAYHLNAGVFAVGKYTYKATTRLGDKVYTEAGAFTVSPLQVEALETSANHALLNTISKNTGAQMVYPAQMQQLPALIQKHEDIKPISYADKVLNDLISIRTLFFVLLALLTAEWILRKYYGGY